MKRKIFAALLVSMGCVGTAQAAERIRCEEIPNRVGPLLEGRRATVVTTEGKRYKGAGFRVEPDQVSLYVGVQDIPFEHIKRIEVERNRTHFFEFTELSGVAIVVAPVAVCNFDTGCAVLVAPVVSSIAIVVTVGSAPVTLIVDGVSRLLPSRVFEIVH
jgi:hypothetical protein